MMAAIVIGVYAMYAVIDLRATVKTRKPGLVWPCILVFAAAAVVQLLFELGVRVPGPTEPITEFITGWFTIR